MWSVIGTKRNNKKETKSNFCAVILFSNNLYITNVHNFVNNIYRVIEMWLAAQAISRFKSGLPERAPLKSDEYENQLKFGDA